ncbi:MAG: universal stress protein [Methanoregulaceae archaeon]|nr:universal stress protein [Methanoregulaceae archaeon]
MRRSFQNHPAGDEPSGEFEGQIASRILTNARQELKTRERSLKEEHFLVRSFVVTGDPSREINRIAAAENAGMIVIGSHRRTNLLHRLIGSVSPGLIQNAPGRCSS